MELKKFLRITYELFLICSFSVNTQWIKSFCQTNPVRTDRHFINHWQQISVVKIKGLHSYENTTFSIKFGRWRMILSTECSAESWKVQRTSWKSRFSRCSQWMGLIWAVCGGEECGDAAVPATIKGHFSGFAYNYQSFLQPV